MKCSVRIQMAATVDCEEDILAIKSSSCSHCVYPGVHNRNATDDWLLAQSAGYFRGRTAGAADFPQLREWPLVSSFLYFSARLDLDGRELIISGPSLRFQSNP
jgi:hypothetical protein